MAKSQQAKESEVEASPPAKLNLSPTHLLHRANQVADDFHTAAFGDTGLTPRQFALLSALQDGAGQSQAQLVEATGIDRSTLADMISRLAKKGLLVRTLSSADRRINLVVLTIDGQIALEDGNTKRAAIDAAFLALLPIKHRTTLLTILQTLIKPPVSGENLQAPKSKKKTKKKKDRKKKRAEPQNV
jgi:MarR family transcriptional regulator, temperature-dependent positive regulator of motility